MGEYKMTHAAVKDLSDIWNYTFETWSEKQADKYYAELMFEFERIADNQFIGRNYEGITETLYGRRINKHVIFYRIVNPEMVEITRILHQRMDLKKHMKNK